MTSSQVFALCPPASSECRLAWARERMQDAFWPIPAVFLAAGVVLAALATFAYSVAFLVLAGGHGHEPESRGLTVAVGLATASLVVFLGYVASTMRLLQVAWLITNVADRTRAAIRQRYAPAEVCQLSPAPGPGSRPVPVALPRSGRSSHAGVLQGVNHHRLVRLAQRHDCVLRLRVRRGEYVSSGADVVLVSGNPPPARKIMAGLNRGRNRTLYQDPAYGLRQLVDIAIQALSPAVNQPTTAIQVIDRLEDILCRIAGAPSLTGYYADAAGRIRLIEPVLSWDDCLDLAFSEITGHGAGSVQVARRLLAAYDVIESCLEPARGAGLQAGRDSLLEQAAARGMRPGELRPDPLGLG